MSAPDIPTSYTISSTTTLGGSVDAGLDDIRIKELPQIRLATDNKLTSESRLTSDSKIDLGLDDIRIKELPRIDLRLETSMKPTRIHFPVNLRFGVQSLGMELLAFSVCGESMVIIEDYVPHRTEICL
jgi:hypothetical protein